MGTVEYIPLEGVSRAVDDKEADKPDCETCDGSSRYEHGDVDCCRLYNDTDCHNYAQKLHIADSSQLVSEQHCGNGTQCLTPHVSRDNLFLISLLRHFNVQLILPLL